MQTSSIALPNANISTEYTVKFNSNKTLNLINHCVRDGTSSSQVSSFVYDYETGIALYEETINITHDDFLFTSIDCDLRDQGTHGLITISNNNLQTPYNLPFTPIYLFITICAFIFFFTLIKRIIFGRLI